MSAASLDDLALDPRSHFEVRVHAAVLLVVDHLRSTGRRTDLTAVVARHPFLSGYLDAAMPFVPPDLSWAETHRWWVEEVGRWEQGEAGHLPICRLASDLDLDPLACSQLLVAGLVDEDSRFGRIFAELNGGTGRRPTLETLAAISRPLASTAAADPVAVLMGLIDEGLLLSFGTEGPRSEWVVQPAPELWEAVRGDRPHGADSYPGGGPSRAFRARHDRRVPGRMRAGRRWSGGHRPRGACAARPGRTGSPSRRPSAALRAAEWCASTGPPSDLNQPRFGALATALDAVPVVELDLLPGETIPVPRRGYRGPVIAVLGRHRRCRRGRTRTLGVAGGAASRRPATGP